MTLGYFSSSGSVLTQRSLTILLMSVAKVTPLFGLSWEPLLLPPREFLLMIPGRTNTHSHIKFNSGKRVKSDRVERCGGSSSPWIGSMSSRCRLFLRDEGKALPLDRRRCRLDSIAAGETIPAGGTFPIFSYSSSISLFWVACRACTSVRCLSEDKQRIMEEVKVSLWSDVWAKQGCCFFPEEKIFIDVFLQCCYLLLSELLQLLQHVLVVTVWVIAAQVGRVAVVVHHP